MVAKKTGDKYKHAEEIRPGERVYLEKVVDSIEIKVGTVLLRFTDGQTHQFNREDEVEWDVSGPTQPPDLGHQMGGTHQPITMPGKVL